MQRSASTTLCDDLNMWHANCTYELLNGGEKNAGAHWSQRLGVSPSLMHSHPSWFVDTVRKALHRPPVFGFKLFPHHPFSASHVTPTTTCVVLRRRNVTAQFVSTKIAQTRDCWDTHGASRCHDATYKVDAKELAAFARACAAWFAKVERFCAGARTTLHVTTEAYLHERAALFRAE